MSQTNRIAAGLAALIAIVVAFAALSPGGKNKNTTTEAVKTATSVTSATVIRVRGGKPLTDIVPITVKKGSTIRLTVVSDTTQEVHFHGYDVKRDAGPGKPAKFVIPATIGGVFEVELEQPGIQLAKVTVGP